MHGVGSIRVQEFTKGSSYSISSNISSCSINSGSRSSSSISNNTSSSFHTNSTSSTISIGCKISPIFADQKCNSTALHLHLPYRETSTTAMGRIRFPIKLDQSQIPSEFHTCTIPLACHCVQWFLIRGDEGTERRNETAVISQACKIPVNQNEKCFLVTCMPHLGQIIFWNL